MDCPGPAAVRRGPGCPVVMARWRWRPHTSAWRAPRPRTLAHVFTSLKVRPPGSHRPPVFEPMNVHFASHGRLAKCTFIGRGCDGSNMALAAGSPLAGRLALTPEISVIYLYY